MGGSDMSHVGFLARRVLAGWFATLAVALAFVTTAQAAYAPINHGGPPLEVAHAKLRAALRCTPSVSTNAREPILLVPGTTLTPEENFSWNYDRSLNALGLPYC